MPKKIYHIRLTDQERETLFRYLRQGKESARLLMRGRILLAADEQMTDEEIAETFKVSMATVARIRRRYCQEGLEAALHEKPRSGALPKADKRLEAQLTLLACSEPPEERARWTLRLLADTVVELEFITAISHTTISRLLKKRTEALVEKAMVYRENHR